MTANAAGGRFLGGRKGGRRRGGMCVISVE